MTEALPVSFSSELQDQVTMSIILFRPQNWFIVLLLSLFSFCSEENGSGPDIIDSDEPDEEPTTLEPIYLAGIWEFSREVAGDSCGLCPEPSQTIRVVFLDHGSFYRMTDTYKFEGRGIQGPDSLRIEITEEVVDIGCTAIREIRGVGLLSDDRIEGTLSGTIIPDADSCGYLASCTVIEDFVITRVKECNCPERAKFSNPKNSPYILPFRAGSSYLCTQSYCTPAGSHVEQLHYDFDMQVGDNIIAARAGIVRTAIDHYPDDGYDFNYVFIEHTDGTVAFYAHLMENSIRVEMGDSVRQGQFFAKSSRSGSPAFPHLHFGVYQNMPPIHGYDVPVNFRNAEGPLDECGGLVRGAIYKAKSIY
jgi:hypothetical protein